jgi:hypothetical protein
MAVLRIRIRCFFTPRIHDPDPGWSNGRIRIRDKSSRIRNSDTWESCSPYRRRIRWSHTWQSVD